MPIVSLCWHWNGFRHGSCPQHFKILSNQDGQYYLWPHKYFTSINELINHHRTNSVARDSRTVILLKDLQEVLFFSTFCNFFFFLHFKGAYTLKKKRHLRIWQKYSEWNAKCCTQVQICFLFWKPCIFADQVIKNCMFCVSEIFHQTGEWKVFFLPVLVESIRAYL